MDKDGTLCPNMRIGTALSNITPPAGMPLSGYAERVGASMGIYDDLFLSTIAFEQHQTRALLIAADLIGLGDAFFTEISQEIEARFAIPPQNILLVASHTHSGPAIPYSFMELRQSDRGYVSGLQSRILSDAALALDRLAGDYRLGVTQGRVTFGINRRKLNDRGEVEMLPNTEAPRDEQLLTIEFRDTSSPRRVILFNYACHADVLALDNRMISADYPGAARRTIESALPQTMAIYLPGCAGDINPNVVDEEGEFHGTYNDVLRLGCELGNEVLRTLTEDQGNRTEPTLSCHAAEVSLHLGAIPPIESFQQMAATDHSRRPPWEPDWAEFARYLLAEPRERMRPFVPVRLTAWNLAEDLVLLGIGAEVSVEYGLWIKQMFAGRTVVPIACTNGQVAYLATRQQILEGGYEAELGNVWYGHPVPFSPESERILLQAIRQFLQQ